MKIHLIQGEFSKKDALDLITEMIHVKIKFHENKIINSHNEEDIKMRETRIKQLQKELYEVRSSLDSADSSLHLESFIDIGSTSVRNKKTKTSVLYN